MKLVCRITRQQDGVTYYSIETILETKVECLGSLVVEDSNLKFSTNIEAELRFEILKKLIRNEKKARQQVLSKYSRLDGKSAIVSSLLNSSYKRQQCLQGCIQRYVEKLCLSVS